MGDHGAKQPGDGGAGESSGKGGPSLDGASRTGIEDRLRAMFDEVASEPVPDRFVELLDRLERTESGPGDRDGGR